MNRLRRIGILASAVSGGGGGLDPEYETYQNAMSVAPGSTWANAANQLFIDLKAALGETNLSDALDIMYILAAETEQAALLNAVNPGTHNATNVNSVAFEASRGMTGNGTSSYLNTNYNPNTQAVNFLLNSASFGIYSRTDIIESKIDMGMTDGSTRCQIMSRSGFPGASPQYGVNFNGTEIIAVADSLSLGVANRSASNSLQYYKTGVSIDTGTSVSTTIPNQNFAICAWLSSGTPSFFSTRQYAFAFAGRSMDATEQSDFYDAVQTFMAAIGANV